MKIFAHSRPFHASVRHGSDSTLILSLSLSHTHTHTNTHACARTNTFPSVHYKSPISQLVGIVHVRELFFLYQSPPSLSLRSFPHFLLFSKWGCFSLSLSLSVCVRACVRLRVCMRACARMCVCVCMRACARMCVCLCVCVCVCVCGGVLDDRV